CDEIAFRVDDALLHPGRRLLEEAPQQVGLAGTGIALNQETGRQQLFQIHVGSAVATAFSHIDRNLHLFSACTAVFSAGKYARRLGVRRLLARRSAIRRRRQKFEESLWKAPYWSEIAEKA